ncbi:fatty acid desaturase family protein [Spirillospora sp. NPDC029432]|uniref:fatty acid desaturase family protein n=1 Tax=Spirillospora sp. NPDC029432 TaxID=3154599 RepID=UPI00345393C1
MKEQIKELHYSRDNWHGFFYLAVDWLVIAAMAAVTVWSGFNVVVYVMAAVVIASRQRALRSLLHEASHYKLMRNRGLNLWAGRLFIAFPLLEGVSGYLCAHCEHHRHLWDERLDPKRRHYSAIGIIRPRNPGRFTRKHLLRSLLLTHMPYNVLSALTGRDEDRKETFWRVLFLAGAGAVTVATGLVTEVVLLWLVPYLTVYQVLRYWSDIADHAGLESDDPWQATRSWTASWPVRQLLAPHNANWHLAHHLYPIVPQHALPRLHRILGGVPEYRGAHQCQGFFLPSRPGRPSVIQDVLRPEENTAYQSGVLRNRGRGAVLRSLFAGGRPKVPDCARDCPLGTVASGHRG